MCDLFMLVLLLVCFDCHQFLKSWYRASRLLRILPAPARSAHTCYALPHAPTYAYALTGTLRTHTLAHRKLRIHLAGIDMAQHPVLSVLVAVCDTLDLSGHAELVCFGDYLKGGMVWGGEVNAYLPCVYVCTCVYVCMCVCACVCVCV